ncbi:MAG: orotidine-5'-phosphate decarboxylase [Desulfamplus sp.]|nr:orotidine-5'-phosphate decarboxylase [Desulfamplus sp.]
MKRGKDYIVFALDVSSAGEAEKYVKILNGKVGMFKIGLELFIKMGPDIIRRVKNLTDAGIFLDLKLHDISETVKRAMEQVAQLGVDLVTVHLSSSPKMLEMAVQGAAKSYGEKGVSQFNCCSDVSVSKSMDSQLGVLGVTLLTDHDASVIESCGFRDIYVQDIQALVMKRAEIAYFAGCRGVVCSGQEVQLIKAKFGKEFLAVTPGIRPVWSIDKEILDKSDDQKRITTPSMAVKAGADLIVVGRPIKRAKDPALAAEKIADEIEMNFSVI